MAAVASAIPTGARRGKLDADLVVDVVLDRARQAAIKLVVSELLRAQKRAGYRYLFTSRIALAMGCLQP